MAESVDLGQIYKLRNDFTIIALTGRSGSGCSLVADQLSKGFDNGKDFRNPFSFGLKHNSYRKYRIIYYYARLNFKPFTRINYRNVLTMFLLQHPFEELVEFLNGSSLKKEFEESGFKRSCDFTEEILALQYISCEFRSLAERYRKIRGEKSNDYDNLDELGRFFFEKEFTDFSEKLHDILKEPSRLRRNKALQVIANNLRRSGHPYKGDILSVAHIYTIVELINDLIKSHRKVTGSAQIVIDALRNPMEINFFKQRYSACYVMAVNREDKFRESSLVGKYTMDSDDFRKLLREEYKGGKDSEFTKQKVETCIQLADIHINFLEEKDAEEKNDLFKSPENKQVPDNTSPYFTWRMQLLKYISLISHPGLVTPSPEERCMQLAYTAKHNSGCISRHVGAAITDEYYSVKAIGWNNTPEGQVPCVLRNAQDLLDNSNDLEAFTPYERSDPEFRKQLTQHYEDQIKKNQANLQGRTACFCFKSLKNSFSEGKNQVHTRSLHAEESAFLQLSKYGGMGIKGGKLFSTASPCELCAKKAYQLGISVIYYIDPYPGISKKQILEAGNKHIDVRLFNGVIGKAYHWLYDPMMSYKDELTLLLGNEIQDLTSKYHGQIKDHEKTISELRAVIEDMKKNAYQ